MGLLLPLAATLYGVASVLYLAYVARMRDGLAGAARAALGAAFGAHLAAIGAQCLHGIHPVSDLREALSLTAWFLVGGYLLATLRYPIAPIGALVAPVTLMLLLGARLAPASAPERGLRWLGDVHISLATVGLAAFTLAAVAAALYLAQEAQIKRRRFGALFHRAPPLADLDAFGHRAVTLGFPVFTVALVTGVAWLAQLEAARRAWSRPEYSVSVVAWLAFAALLVARLSAGWRGRRAAWLTLFGFGTALVVVALYVARGLGG